MLDPFKRRINYLRISVTDRCNLRCRYCMPEKGIRFLSNEDILSFEEIYEFVKVAVDAGIQYVTGPNDNIHFGISLRNIGTPMRYSGEGLSFTGKSATRILKASALALKRS